MKFKQTIRPFFFNADHILVFQTINSNQSVLITNAYDLWQRIVFVFGKNFHNTHFHSGGNITFGCKAFTSTTYPLHPETQKAHHQARALRPTCRFPHMTREATLMMGSLCFSRFLAMPDRKTLQSLGH